MIDASTHAVGWVSTDVDTSNQSQCSVLTASLSVPNLAYGEAVRAESKA